MDATEYREFSVAEVRDEIVVFHKQSNKQDVEVPLRAIRDITPSVNRDATMLRYAAPCAGEKISSDGDLQLSKVRLRRAQRRNFKHENVFYRV